MERYGMRGIKFRFPVFNSFRRYRSRGSPMNHTRGMVVFLFFTVLTHDVCYTRIGAVNTGGSGTNQDTHGKTSLESGGSDIIWNDDLLQSLVFIWMESDPTTEKHAERMFQMWSSNPSKYPAISKEKLYEIARKFIVEGENPLDPATIEKLKKIRRGPLKLEKYQKWPLEFKADVDNFLAELPEGKLKLERPICDVFFERHTQYTDLDRRAVGKYLNNERWHKKMTFGEYRGSHSPNFSFQPLQASNLQQPSASSSQIPQRDPHLQKYSDPHHSQPSYVAYAHSSLFSWVPQFPQYHQIHHFPDRLHHGGPLHCHEGGFSWTPHSHVEQSATQRLSHMSGEHGRRRRSRTRSKSESSSSRGDNDSLDLDLHL